ncbi:MAG: hypothetical protein IKE55_00010, partial [Kiritimatiellae bacterium]|nr:hypothetical protein [Kiritimatiellia bacterium]
ACVPLGRRDLHRHRAAVAALAPFDIDAEARPPRQPTRGMKHVEYWQGTNRSAIVCAFLPEKSPVWYLAVWELAEKDDFAERMDAFEWKFLEGEWKTAGLWLGGDPVPETEREQLRADAHHSVTNYEAWRWTDTGSFTILDDLPRTSDFVAALTNELLVLQARYAAAVPTPLDASNALCVARIYRSREEYLDAVGDDMAWSAAYWSPVRRELVAHLPEAEEAALMRTMRHEAFHQYLSYACSMISASPWLNEGYAQYFEDEDSRDWGEGIDAGPEVLKRLAQTLPGLMMMDYDEFYGGSDAARRMKYRLAWSIAVFVEKGAPEVRFRPFAKLKADYFEALLESRDMKRATLAALLGDADKAKLFVEEWVKFWERQ